jgi:hypothetical protein
MYPGQSKEFKRTVKEYIETVRKSILGAGVGAAVNVCDSRSEIMCIELDSNGFPIAPKISTDLKPTKRDLEQLYRLYITHHYREWKSVQETLVLNLLNLTGLASRDRDRQTPFESIALKNTDFVDAEYLPNGIKLSDPRTMYRDSLIKFFQHISSREASHGIENAFRFKSIHSSRKKGVIRAARYKENNVESDVPSVTVRRRNRKERENSKQIGRSTESAPNEIPQNTESGQNDITASGTNPAPVQIPQIPAPTQIAFPTHNPAPVQIPQIPAPTQIAFPTQKTDSVQNNRSVSKTRRPTKKSTAPVPIEETPTSNIRRSTRINTAQLQSSGPRPSSKGNATALASKKKTRK